MIVRHRYRAGLALILLATAPMLAAEQAGDSQRVNALADAYFDERLALVPMFATRTGEHRYDDRVEDSASAGHQQAEEQLARKYRERLVRLDTRRLDESARVTYDVLAYTLETTLAGAPFPQYLLPLDPIYSMPQVFASYGSGLAAQPFRSVEDYERFLRRCDGFSAWVDSAIGSMRIGLQRSIAHPRPVVERLVSALEVIASAQPQESPFWKPIDGLPQPWPQAQREQLTAAWRAKLVEVVLPSYRRLADFVRKEYLPGARNTVGWSALPNGAAWYRHAVRVATTLDLDPNELHELGLREVARLHGEMDAVRLRTGFKGDLPAFMRFAQSDPQFFFADGAQTLAAYRAIKVKVDARLPELFRALPKIGYEIREMEAYRAANTPGAQYAAAPPDYSRPGIFYINTHDPRGLPSYIAESLSLHEAAPGHYLQIETARELTDLPRLRRYYANAAYQEGWALYGETLGKDLGLYEDPYQWYGHLTEQILRAMRLVVDTGLHVKGWTREQAVRYMLDNSSTTQETVHIEVDRYIVWPGQALGYQVGKLKILELRERARKQLGERFDIRDFHKEVLNGGQLPLGVLEKKIDRWVQARRASR